MWADITEKKILSLTGTNAESGPKVGPAFFAASGRGFSPSFPTPGQNPWVELDREQGPGSELWTLGLQGDPSDPEIGESWGGRVEQRAVLSRIQQPPSLCRPSHEQQRFAVVLQQHAVRSKSYRLARKFGSRRLIQLKLPDLTKINDDERSAIGGILQRGFLINGRIFRAFSGSDGGVYLIETDENFDRKPVAVMGDNRRLSFFKFVEWFNPMDQNGSQVSKENLRRKARF